MTMDASLRLTTFSQTLILFLGLLTIATVDPKFCSGESGFHCMESERQALLRFKQDLKDPSNRLPSWAGDGDCCQWVGVVCHNVTGHVQELHLRSFPPTADEEYYYYQNKFQYQAYRRSLFSGKINPSLLDLKHLIYLDLSYNDFGGIQIPKFLGSMGSLRYLNLSAAGFGGAIPHQLGNLSNLHYLNLRDDEYSYDLYVMNLQWLSGLPLLQHLDMSYVNFSKASNWLQEANKLPSLLELLLSGCQLSSFIPPTPSINFSSLSILDLSINYYASNPIWVFGLYNLVSLDLSFNSFQGSIPVDLQNMTSLRRLDLSFNNFNSSIPIWLYGFSSLEFLNMNTNDLHGTISSAIENLTSAISIDLSINELGGKVPRSLGNLCNLREIRLSSNNWNQEMSKILESLSGCVLYGLEVLDLFNANLSGHLTENLGQFQNLALLSLGHNSISGPIPISMGNLTSLRFLDLFDNQINGTLPPSFGQLSKLESIEIASNMMEGVVSEVHFANLMRLRTLAASSNQLTFEVSHNWIPPFQLNYLNLASWNLGKFPLWLCSQKHLFSLDLSNTGILDTISLAFWNLPFQFEYLNFSHNQIYGEIPNIVVNLSFPSRIDMRSNHFKGSIPFLSSFVGLLDLSMNLFSGSISHFLCYKMNEPKNMEYLNLGSNLLSGIIIDCWMSWQSLKFLNLGDNNFTGSVPASIGSLSLLHSLHLYHNKLFGKLPSSLKNCEMLVIVDIGENEFVGNIPSWIGHRLSRLMILSFRSNNFHGHIPKELCSLTSLQILDFSHNKLFGSIPRCVSNFNAMATKNSSNPNILFMNFLGPYDMFERALVVMKGRVLEYSTTLQLVKSIDLSKNNLSREIPQELTSLQQLESLNLSFNILTGRIPESIGIMRSLESIDFSANQLSGQIPQSILGLTFLSHLNLSYNNLIGKIPIGTQLQSFNGSSFVGNQLCGPPLSDNCTTNDVTPNIEHKGSKDNGRLEVDWFYVSMALGFVVGFWVVLGPLLLNKHWRFVYFQILDHLGYKLRGIVAQTW